VTATASERPLGVRPEIALTEAQRHTLEVLQDYDLTPVRERLLRDASMPLSWVDEAIFEFRRYLGLSAVVPERVMMFSKQVDEVWHVCLLFSRLYAAWCDAAFGRFVHHEPARGPDPDRQASWRIFEESYERLYGPPGRLWQMARPREHSGPAAR
jgi:hypothetical protein